MTATAVNVSQIGRLLAGATGGTGVISSFVALPLDGTPTTAYVATANGRLWTGYKAGASATPTWTEYAKLTSPAFNSSLTVNGPFSGSTSFVAARSTGEIQSGVTSSFTAFDSVNSTVAAAFTLPALAHFRATGATVNSPSVVSNQYGFRVLSNLTAATNNYAFYSDLATAANVARALGEERERAQLAETEAEIRAEMAAQERDEFERRMVQSERVCFDMAVAENERMTKAEALNVALVAALEALLPGEKAVRRSGSVEVGLACGRAYLSVNGIVVAMEGDVCRDVVVSRWHSFGGAPTWKADDFKRIEAEFNEPIRAALRLAREAKP
jgi:hypothetical protein